MLPRVRATVPRRRGTHWRCYSRPQGGRVRHRPAREDWLRLYLDILSDDGAQPKVRAALDRAVKAGLSPERAAALGRTAPVAEEPADEGNLAPTDADCVRFTTLFAGRENAHARQ